MGLILLIEDDDDVALSIREVLEPEHKVMICKEAKKAPLLFSQMKFNLVLLDVMLSDGNGFDLLTRLRQNPNFQSIPVLFTTGQASTADQVLGFSLGAEDYIIKPIDPILFRVRVNAKIKKYSDNLNSQFTLGDLKFDLLKQKLFLIQDQKETEVELTSLEFKLLQYFAHHEGQVFSRNQIMTAVWGENIYILDRTIDSHISRIRNKLKLSQYTIEPVHGVGYRMMCNKNSSN